MKMSQSTRILLLLALLVAALAVWYGLFFNPSGGSEEDIFQSPPDFEQETRALPPSTPVTTSARTLQVLPIPFLVTDSPEEFPLESEDGEEAAMLASASTPPNPFVQLRPPKVASANRPHGTPTSQRPIPVTPGQGLPSNMPQPKFVTPNGTPGAPPVGFGQGALPIKLSVLDRKVEPLAEVNTPGAPPPVPTKTPPNVNPLDQWARMYGLHLDGVALGPVSVAIFKTANGYLALPVGQTFPGNNVLVKTITAERALLVDGSGTHTLTLELGGGE